MGRADRRRKARNNKKRTKRISRNTGTLPKTVHENIEEVGSNSGDVVAMKEMLHLKIFIKMMVLRITNFHQTKKLGLLLLLRIRVRNIFYYELNSIE